MANHNKGQSVLIIGAGLAGLTAGSYLAQRGFAVKIVEANQKIGGCCASTLVDGFTFHDGAQYLIYWKLLDLVFAQLGVDRSEILPLQVIHTPQTTYLPDNIAVQIGENYSISVDNYKIDISRCQHELEIMVNKWGPVNEIFTDESIMLHPFSLPRLLSKGWKHLPKFGRTLLDEFNILFSDRVFRSAVAAQLLYAGAPFHKLPSIGIIALVSALKDGMALPIGGMGKIPESLSYIFRRYGGELVPNLRVKDILVKNGRVCGVRTEHDEMIESGLVISTVNAMSTYKNLLGEVPLVEGPRAKVERTPLSAQAFSIQLGLSNTPDISSHLNYVVPLLDGLDQYLKPARDKADLGYYSCPTAALPDLAPPKGSVIEYIPAIRQAEPLDAWNDERIEQLASASIAYLQSRFEMNIKVKRIRSPREFSKQLNLFQGAVYGVSASAGLNGLFSHRTPIQGLYLAGQTTYPGLGVPTAALSGIHAGKALIDDYPGDSRKSPLSAS